MKVIDPAGLAQAIAWRSHSITPDTDAFRLCSGISDGIDGLFVDRFGDFIAATVYDPLLATGGAALVSAMESIFPGKPILVKARKNAASNEYEYFQGREWKRDAVLTATEAGLRYEIHTDPRHDFGLYLDTKAARSALAARFGTCRILNLFSYTCAFAVAATKSGADVVNIDPSREYLDWGGRNAELNGMAFRRYVDTTQGYLARHLRRLESGRDRAYDICIVDPPAFLVGRGSQRLARNMWTLWAEQLERCGCNHFLLVLNDKSMENRNQQTDELSQIFHNTIHLEPIPQSIDVLGQQLTTSQDSFYLTPSVFLASRK